jgi:hypothetical protein
MMRHPSESAQRLNQPLQASPGERFHRKNRGLQARFTQTSHLDLWNVHGLQLVLDSGVDSGAHQGTIALQAIGLPRQVRA